MKWPRVHLVQVMAVIALLAVGLRVPDWWGETVLRPPDWWVTYWRQKPARDAWGSPITIRVKSQDDLGSVLSRFKTATACPRLRRGLWVFVDPGGLREAGQSLESPVGTEFDAMNMAARDSLRVVLEPLGLACKLEDGAVMVTSGQSIDEPIEYGPNHGEVFCSHGERVPIRGGVPNP